MDAGKRGIWWRAAPLALALAGATGVACAQDFADETSTFPTTRFAEGARSASTSLNDVTATIVMERHPDVNPDVDVPVLKVIVDGHKVLESIGVEDVDTDQPAAVASIAEIDPANSHPEVYFSSYNGGCCSTVIVAEELGDSWVAVPIGDFDGDEDYLQDLNGDGRAEIATIDINFLSRFDCTACSAAPRVIYSVEAGKVVDLSADPSFHAAHTAWLKILEGSIDPETQWSSRGFLAGWLAEKIRLGEGAEAWQELNSHWDLANDPGEETCPNGDDPEACPEDQRKVVTFPERLRLFLTSQGYTF